MQGHLPHGLEQQQLVVVDQVLRACEKSWEVLAHCMPHEGRKIASLAFAFIKDNKDKTIKTIKTMKTTKTRQYRK